MRDQILAFVNKRNSLAAEIDRNVNAGITDFSILKNYRDVTLNLIRLLNDEVDLLTLTIRYTEPGVEC